MQREQLLLKQQKSISMKKTYYFPPNFDYPPKGFLWPGRILTDPFDPVSCLTREIEVPPYPADTPLRESFKIDWNGDTERKRSGLIGLWLRFLEFVGIETSASISWSKGDADLYTIPRLETKFIEPSKDYIEERAMLPEVASFIVETDFKKPIYLVTGVKVAYGASMAWDKWHEIAAGGKFGASGTAAGAPGGGGFETNAQDSSKQKTGFRKSSPIVFGFQIREIYYDKDLNLQNKSFDKNAVLYDLNNEEKPTEEKKAVVESSLNVVGLADEEETALSLGKQRVTTLDEDGEECECMIRD
jgi:hypothetical protein